LAELEEWAVTGGTWQG